MGFDREAARARCDAATEGPWTLDSPPEASLIISTPTTWAVFDGEAETDDAEFIAHARTDLPAALDQLEAAEVVGGRLAKELAQAEEERDRLRDATLATAEQYQEHLDAQVTMRDRATEKAMAAEVRLAEARFLLRESRPYVAAHESDPQHLVVSIRAFLAREDQK